MKILMILAHPDDEVLFGFPILQYKEYPKSHYMDKTTTISLLTLSDNAEKYGEGPIQALQEVCRYNQVNVLSLPRTSTNFYRCAPRYENRVLRDVIQLFRKNIETAIGMTQPDFIFTHNPMGEYGHGDHRFVFNLVAQYDVPLLLTDICFSIETHLSSEDIPKIYKKCLYNKEGVEHHLDLAWYERMKTIYERHGAWSWSGHESVKLCNLYAIQ